MDIFTIRVQIDEHKEVCVQSDTEENTRKLADEVTEKYFGDSYSKKLSQ